MTPEDYAGRSKAIEFEMTRIRGLLDDAAIKKDRLGVEASRQLIRKAHDDLNVALERWKTLDREFWVPNE